MNAYNPEITIIPAPNSVYLSGTSLKNMAPNAIAKNRRVYLIGAMAEISPNLTAIVIVWYENVPVNIRMRIKEHSLNVIDFTVPSINIITKPIGIHINDA